MSLFFLSWPFSDHPLSKTAIISKTSYKKKHGLSQSRIGIFDPILISMPRDVDDSENPESKPGLEQSRNSKKLTLSSCLNKFVSFRENPTGTQLDKL